MDHSGVTGDSCEKDDNLVTVNKEIISSSNADESADKSSHELATSLCSYNSASLPTVSEDSTTLVTTSCNTQPPSSVSTFAATSVDVSLSASAMDGKNSAIIADAAPINTVANSTLPQDSSCKTIPVSSDTVDVNSTPINSSLSMTTSTSVVTEPKLTVGSSTGAIPTNSLKLDSSMVKTEQKNLSYVPFQAPAATKAKMSTYDSSKVAAEMAEIDSFLKSLASGTSGGSSNNHDSTKPAPLVSSSIAAVNDIVVKPATGGSALGRIAQSYGDSDESSSSSDESEDEGLGATAGNKIATAPDAVAMDTSEVEQSMKKVAVSSDSSDSSSSSGSDDELGDGDETPKKQQQVIPRTKNEILPQDLLPILPLDVVLPEDAQLELIGWVHSIVKQIVVVAHNSKLRVVNVDTVFWLEDHSPLGKVFEVFGPVAHPYYSIRIHRNDEKELSYAVGSKVFFISNDSNLTYYVFPNHIEKQKGSDASWLNDEEPPAQFLDYSDDENEVAVAKKEGRKQRMPPAASHQGPRKKKHSHKSTHRVDSQASQAIASSKSYTSDPHLQKYFLSAIDQQGRTQLTSQAIPQPPYYLPPPQQLGNMPSPSFPSNPTGTFHTGQINQVNAVPSSLYYPPYPPPMQPCPVPPPPQAMAYPPGIPLQPVPHQYPQAASQGLLPASQPPQSGAQSYSSSHSMLPTISETNPNTNSFV